MTLEIGQQLPVTLVYSLIPLAGLFVVRPLFAQELAHLVAVPQRLMLLTRRGFQIYVEDDRTRRIPQHAEKARNNRWLDHKKKFFEAVRSRKQPEANFETGHQASVMAHLANISYRTGRKIVWNADSEKITGDPEASKLLTPNYRKPWKLEI